MLIRREIIYPVKILFVSSSPLNNQRCFNPEYKTIGFQKGDKKSGDGFPAMLLSLIQFITKERIAQLTNSMLAPQ